MSAPIPAREVGPTVYERLDLTGVRLDKVLVGNRGRADMLRTARHLGYAQWTVTPALTLFSRVYVIQLHGDRDTGTVALAGRDGGEVTVRLPEDFRRHYAPPAKVAALLAAVEAGYPPGSLTATLAECLAGVLDRCAQQRREGRHSVPVRALEETLGPPLRAFLAPWTTPAQAPTSTTPRSTQEEQ